MNLEEATIAYRDLETEYKQTWRDLYVARGSYREDHETRLEMALTQIDPELHKRYTNAIKQVEVERAKLDERMVTAHEELVAQRMITKEWLRPSKEET